MGDRVECSYIEIVHITPGLLDSLREYGDFFGEDPVLFGGKLRSDPRFQHFHFLTGSLDRNLPQIPHSSTIILGGGLGERCVRIRAANYAMRGFREVYIDQSLTIFESWPKGQGPVRMGNLFYFYYRFASFNRFNPKVPFDI